MSNNKQPTITAVEDALKRLSEEKTVESAINYAVKYFERFKARQGYYDYFIMSKNDPYSVFKGHYAGNYVKFTYDGKDENGTLKFNVIAYAENDFPRSMSNYEALMESLLEEIKKRSFSDVIKPAINKINSKIKQFCDVKLTFSFNVKWKIKIID